jgi:hypothetical protein
MPFWSLIMTDALQTILDYLNTPHTDHALLITGPWGCGKTFFWKHVVEDEIRALSKKPIYASLYGCGNKKDIDIQLLLASRMTKKKDRKNARAGGAVASGVLKKFTGIDLATIGVRHLIDTENAVFCFDDLERTVLPMQEALGHINTFVEQQGIKTIILCNEDEIRPGKDEDTYRAMKEKTVRVSLSFQAKCETVLPSLILEYKDQAEFSAFLKEQQPLIAKLFRRSETDNIRLLRRALSVLWQVHHALKNGGQDPKLVAAPIVYSTLPTILELGSGRAEPEDMQECHSGSYASLYIGCLVREDKTEGETKSYQRVYMDRYLTDGRPSDVTSSPPICELAITGFLDRDALIAWAKEQTDPPESTSAMQQLISEQSSLEDAEYSELAEQALKEVDTGQLFGIGTYLNGFSFFRYWTQQRLLECDLGELTERFKNGLQRAQEAGNLEYTYNLGFGMPAPETYEAKELHAFAAKVNKDVHQDELRTQATAALDIMDTDPDRFIAALTGFEPEDMSKVPILSYADIPKMTEWIMGLSNGQKYQFTAAIRGRYERVHYDSITSDLPALQELHASLSGRLSNAKGSLPLSEAHLQEIVRWIECGIKSLNDWKG